MFLRHIAQSAVVLTSLLAVNIAIAATHKQPPAEQQQDINTLRATKMAHEMKKDLHLSDAEADSLQVLFKGMLDRLDKFRAAMDEETAEKIKAALTPENYQNWEDRQQKYEEERAERLEKKREKMLKEMKKEGEM